MRLLLLRLHSVGSGAAVLQLSVREWACQNRVHKLAQKRRCCSLTFCILKPALHPYVMFSVATTAAGVTLAAAGGLHCLLLLLHLALGATLLAEEDLLYGEKENLKVAPSGKETVGAAAQSNLV